MTNWNQLLGPGWWERAYALAHKLTGPQIYPENSLVFSAFDEVDPGAVSVIILGQDPYHTPEKARGVAFGYHPKYRGPTDSSLANIIRECGATVETFDRSLRHWTAQGVLLLNTRLTVPSGQPMGHAGRGWEELMQEALQRIVQWAQPVVLCWGREAQRFADTAPCWIRIDTSHPSSYSANQGRNPFTGSRCFERVNEKLVEQGERPINWTGLADPTFESDG